MYERSVAWLRRRDETREEEKKNLERQQEKECTFQPNLLTPSTSDRISINATLGYAVTTTAPHYHQPLDLSAGQQAGGLSTPAGRPGGEGRAGGGTPSGHSVTERLYKQGVQHKRHMQEKLRARLQVLLAA